LQSKVLEIDSLWGVNVSQFVTKYLLLCGVGTAQTPSASAIPAPPSAQQIQDEQNLEASLTNTPNLQTAANNLTQATGELLGALGPLGWDGNLSDTTSFNSAVAQLRASMDFNRFDIEIRYFLTQYDVTAWEAIPLLNSSDYATQVAGMAIYESAVARYC